MLDYRFCIVQRARIGGGGSAADRCGIIAGHVGDDQVDHAGAGNQPQELSPFYGRHVLAHRVHGVDIGT